MFVNISISSLLLLVLHSKCKFRRCRTRSNRAVFNEQYF